MLWKLATEHNADILVTGMHGRKGPKADPTVAGTTVKYLASAVDVPIPICIVKDPRTRAMKPDGKYRFGVCYDGSVAAAKALRTALSMMMPEDYLVIITVKESSIKLDQIESSVNSICAEYGISNQKVQVLEREIGTNIF